MNIGRSNRHEQSQIPQRHEAHIDINAELKNLYSGLLEFAGPEDESTEEIPPVQFMSEHKRSGTFNDEVDSTAAHEVRMQSSDTEDRRADSARRLRAMLNDDAAKPSSATPEEKLRMIRERLGSSQSHRQHEVPTAIPATHTSTLQPWAYAGYPYDISGHAGFQVPVNVPPARDIGNTAESYSNQSAESADNLRLTTPYERTGEVLVSTEAEGVDKKRRNPLDVIKRMPRRQRVGAVAGIVAIGVVGGALAKQHYSETARAEMIVKESAVFKDGLMPSLLNCQDPNNALNLQMTSVTQTGLRAKVQVQVVKSKEIKQGYFPTSARMAANIALRLCESKDNAGKPFANYVNGQWHVNRSAVSVFELTDQLKVPACGFGETLDSAQGCTVARPQAWFIGDERITEANRANYAMTSKDQDWALKLVADNPNEVQKQFLDDSTLQLYTKALGKFDTAGNSCSNALDNKLGKFVLDLSKKVYNAVPDNSQVVFDGQYGSLAKRTLGGKIGEVNGKPVTVTDRLSKSFVEIDDTLNTSCRVLTASEAKANSAPPAQAPPSVQAPPTTQPTPKATTTTNGAKP